MTKKRNKEKNYLEFIPVRNERFLWEQDEQGKIIIFVENKGLFNRIAQRLLGKPKVSQVHLEEMGNFIWPLIDGKASVYEIARQVHEEFGKKADPLYERLAVYMQTLENYGFIKMNKG